ncbi:MAG TPA: DUF4199 domain-containing protein [Chryseosolibacter sp.]|nr:DUF4199 domain-containing protein [Chryseosolibacter sp.]
MEQTQPLTDTPVTTRSAGIRYGVIAAVISIVFFLALNISGVDMTASYWSWIGYLITAVIVFLAHKYYKENGDSYMNYGQGIGIAFWQGLIGAGISHIFTYIYIKFIDGAFIDNVIDAQRAGMEERGMSDEQIDQAMEFSASFMTPEVMMLMGFLFAILGTVIIALIVTIFTQKSRPETI